MLNFFRQLFRDEPELNTEIPRYPPFAKGLPSVREDRLLTTQQELVDKLRQALPFNRAQFDALMLPVIKRYAAFVHLLPASETHHHRGAGGLLHHGLEVAHIAARSSEDVMFAANEEPRRRRELEPRWRLAVCLAGLTHDVGKPVSDLSVTDSTGEHVWNAYTENLAEWTARESVNRYFLHWHKGRHRRHEQFSVLVMERVLTRECLNWLAQYGPEIPHALLNSVAMADTENNDIGPLIRRADNTSVERDMKRYQSAPNESLGVPVERYIIDAMRRLISQRKWQPNEKGSRLWVLTDGLHVVWPAAAHEITSVLQRDGVAGVPRDPDSIADILIDRGLAKPRETESTTYRYWPMRPASFEDKDPNRLMMLRLSDPYLLFSEAPPAMNAEVIESRSKPKPPAVSEQDGAPVTDKPAKVLAKKHHSEPILADAPAEVDATSEVAIERPKATAPPIVEANSPDAQLAAALPHLQEADDDLAPAAREQQAVAVEATPSSNGLIEAVGGTTKPGRARKRRREKSKKDETSEGASPSLARPAPAVIDFEAGQAEHILQALHAKGEWETHLFKRRDQVIVAYPDGAALAGSPTDVQRLLADEGLLKTDPMSPMLKVQTVEGIKGLLFTPRISALFLGAVPKADEKAPVRATQNTTGNVDERSACVASESAQGPQPTRQQTGDHLDEARPRLSDGDAPQSEASAHKSKRDSKSKHKGADNEHNKPTQAGGKKARRKGASASSRRDDTQAVPDDASRDLAQGLVDVIRDASRKIPCRRDHRDGWIHVSQVMIQWYASSLMNASAAAVRAAAASHPDIALEGKSRIGVREKVDG